VRNFPDLGMKASTATLGMSVAVAIGLAAGFWPAMHAYRARITETLREV